MNKKQALKKANEYNQKLEEQNANLADFNRRASLEIKALNVCIDSVIAGEKTFCDWCEEQEACQRECKGKGCAEWWLMLELPALPGEEETNDSERILSARPDC